MLTESRLVVIHPTDDSRLADDIGNALIGEHGESSLHVIQSDHGLLRIRQQRVGQAQGLSESPVNLHRIGADPDDSAIHGLYGFMYITEATRFDRSPFGEVLEVKVENHVLEASPLGQLER
jgi:hypothetical protein